MILHDAPPPMPGTEAGGWRVVARRLRSCATGCATDCVDLFFPSDCRVCGLPLVELGAAPVCPACLSSVEMQRGPLCGRCGTTLGWESIRFTESMGSVECPTCRLAPPAFARAVAFAEYDSEVREMLHLLKFEHERAVAGPMLGARLAQAIATLLDGTARELLVVPVPLFRTREAERGFNQAEVLARSAVMALRTTHPAWKLRLRADVLRRVKATPSLYDLTPSQRRSALQGAFSVANAAAIQGREVLLIDDIMTTGSTAHACASALRRAGATRVRVATVARAQPERFTHRAHAPEAGNDARADVSLWGAEDGNF